MSEKSNIGLIGLAVMGENLVLNMESNGFSVSVFNRTVNRVEAFLKGRGSGKKIRGSKSIEEFCAQLETPRKIMMLVKAGAAVDDLIEQILPYLDEGDIIIDGGNSYYKDTIRRTAYVEKKGFLYLGAGVSGGEEGALKGPSVMPGGSEAAWLIMKPILQKISAKTESGDPCCDWVSRDGSGHFVKMIHNGIEYGDMQMICEVYQMMKVGLKLTNRQMADHFSAWNQRELDSYLIEITSDILGYESEAGEAVVDSILDVAGQKGTGKWTAVSALDYGQPLTLIGEAVFARFLSSLKDERSKASKILSGPKVDGSKFNSAEMIDNLEKALYASKIVSYAQGYQLMDTVAKEHNWTINKGSIALMWRGGCIIRSVFLGKIKEAFDRDPSLSNLLLDPFFKKALEDAQEGWRSVIITATELGIAMPAISAALNYYDGYRTERLPANLLQAQRDYFGAHTYERIDSPRGEFFHTNWTGRGGDTAAGTYSA